MKEAEEQRDTQAWHYATLLLVFFKASMTHFWGPLAVVEHDINLFSRLQYAHRPGWLVLATGL